LRESHHADGEDIISWRLDTLGTYSTNFMYLRLSQGRAVLHFKDVWRTRVPPKITVPLATDPREQVAKRQDPSDGNCALCREIDDCSHIFFGCSLAKFMWARVREDPPLCLVPSRGREISSDLSRAIWPVS
jgi:hypothetical protein